MKAKQTSQVNRQQTNPRLVEVDISTRDKERRAMSPQIQAKGFRMIEGLFVAVKSNAVRSKSPE